MFAKPGRFGNRRYSRLRHLRYEVERGLTVLAGKASYPGMEEMIYPRSPREMMCGWVYLPRFIDKVRLHLAGKLHPEYEPNFTKAFDGKWLEAAGVEANTFIEVVKNSITDGQVCDWVRKNVRATEAEKAAFNSFILNRGNDDEGARARLAQRKRDMGKDHRDDIKTFVDLIEADEKRM
jgi:hypothetical protein